MDATAAEPLRQAAAEILKKQEEKTKIIKELFEACKTYEERLALYMVVMQVAQGYYHSKMK
jgi:TRAP-type mannitol/chloroaromatic compound transport system substrate-binding protein